MDDIGLKVFEALSPLFIAAVAWVALKVSQLITAKVKNEYLRGALIRLDDAVLTAVKEIQQTAVEAIKTANADGVLTDDEKKEIKAKAVLMAKSHLGRKGIMELMKVLGLDDGSVATLIGSKIESAVLDLRTATPGPQIVP